METWNEKELKEQIKEIISFSQDFKNKEPKVDALYNKWYENKKRFIQKMNGKLIYEYPIPVCFEMSEKDKIKNIEDFITDIEYEYFGVDNIDNIMFFLEENKTNIYSNILQKDFEFYDERNDKKIVIKKGIKINKALKFFFYPDEKEKLTNLQMAISRIIQKDKINGTLCFSVHPLDYLSSSENTYNWRTCHSLDGEYRAGNLSYMTDKATIVCYLKSEKNYELPNFPPKIKWNSKKWRVLIHISNDNRLMFAGRPYPFFSLIGLNYVKRLVEKITNDIWSDWSNNQITSFKLPDGRDIKLDSGYIFIDHKIKAINEIVKTKKDSKNYNDVLYSNYYVAYYSYNNSAFFTNDKTTIVEIGDDIPCLCCEKENVCATDLFRCIKCEEKYGTELHDYFDNCDICGNRRYELFYTEYGNLICADCVEKHNYVHCRNCNIYMKVPKNGLKISENILLCNRCYNWKEKSYG